MTRVASRIPLGPFNEGEGHASFDGAPLAETISPISNERPREQFEVKARSSGSSLGVVVNPHAGGNRDERRRAIELQRVVGDRGKVYETGGLDEVEDVAREFHSRRIDIIAICGGDGSFFRTLSALVRVYGDEPLPLFLPLRAGSMNTIARAVGCKRGTPEAVLAALAEDYGRGRPVDIARHRLIRVNDHSYGFLVGAGLIVNFLQAYYGRPQRGPLAAASLLARVCAGGLVGSREVERLFDVPDAAIAADGTALGRGLFRVIFASTVAEIGLGFRLAYRAGAGVDAFHLLAGSPTPLQVLGGLPRVRLGRGLGIDGWHDVLTQKVAVEFVEPTRYMIDGDILEAVTRLELSTGPSIGIIRK